MKNSYCLLVKQFQLPAKHFFLQNIYFGVAKGLQFSGKANKVTDKKGSLGQCSQSHWVCDEAKAVAAALFDENMKEFSNRLK